MMYDFLMDIAEGKEEKKFRFLAFKKKEVDQDEEAYKAQAKADAYSKMEPEGNHPLELEAYGFTLTHVVRFENLDSFNMKDSFS